MLRKKVSSSLSVRKHRSIYEMLLIEWRVATSSYYFDDLEKKMRSKKFCRIVFYNCMMIVKIENF